MDNYSEQLVEKIRTSSDMVKVVLILLLSSLIAGLMVFFALMTGFLLLIALGVVAVIVGINLVGNVGIEYEYIITNNELDIDKIIGKRKRKRMITVDLKLAEDFAPYSADSSPDCDVTVRASSGVEKDIHYLLAEHNEYGKVKIIFNPNKKTREAIALAVPGQLRARMVTENGK